MQEWLTKEDSASPMVSLESIMVTTVIDAMEGQDIMMVDIPNAFIQMEMEIEPGKDRVIMKIMGALVDILLQNAPDVYSGYVVYENGKKVLYVEVSQAIYGMLVAALLFYRKFKGDLEEIGFTFNP